MNKTFGHKITCTFPAYSVRGKEDIADTKSPRCGCRMFKVFYNEEKGFATIVCHNDNSHILTTFTLQQVAMSEVQQNDGTIDVSNGNAIDNNRINADVPSLETEQEPREVE